MKREATSEISERREDASRVRELKILTFPVEIRYLQSLIDVSITRETSKHLHVPVFLDVSSPENRLAAVGKQLLLGLRVDGGERS